MTLQADLVPQVLAGELLLVPALGEPGAALPRTPATTYDGNGVTGTKVGVPVLEARRCCSSPRVRRSRSSIRTVPG